MDLLEMINETFRIGAQMGVVSTLEALGKLDEGNRLTVNQAKCRYGKKMLDMWLGHKMVHLYPTGNDKRSRYYVLRSECETAKQKNEFAGIMLNAEKMKRKKNAN